MSQNVNIGYIGDDNLFLGKVEAFTNLVKAYECNIIQFNYKQGHVYHFLKESSIHLFIVDIHCNDLNINLLNEISRIKKLNVFKSTVFVAALDSREEKIFNLLQSMGFSLGCLKGTDERVFLTDALFLATGTMLQLPSFASAYKQEITNEVSVCSSIVKFNKTSICIESDIVFDTTNFSFSLPMFESQRIKSLEPNRITECFGSYNHLYLMNCAFQFVGPWDTASEDSIYEEDLSNWIDLNEDELLEEDESICVFSKSVSFYDELFDNEPDSCIEIRDELNADGDIDLLESLGTKVVLIELDKDIDLEKSISLIKEASYLEDQEMIFILFNCNSTSMALRKLTNTNNVLASKFNLSVDLYKVFIDKFISTRKDLIKEKDYRMSDLNPKRMMDIYFDIKISSISEHEVCFVSEFEIPYYTVMHSKLPVPFYFTVIPETKPLPRTADKFHYQALIHTVNELDFEALRRVVNKLIVEPVEEFTDESVELLASPDAPVVQEQMIEPEEKKELLSDKNNLKINNLNLNRKSKL